MKQKQKQKQKQVKQMFQLHEQKAESFQCFRGTETETMFHMFHSRQRRVEEKRVWIPAEPANPVTQPIRRGEYAEESRQPKRA